MRIKPLVLFIAFGQPCTVAMAQEQSRAAVASFSYADPTTCSGNAESRKSVGRKMVNHRKVRDEWTPNGSVGQGEEMWRSGPGGFTLLEEYHSQTPGGEIFGLALTWWDRAKGFQGTWCEHRNPKGCDINPGAPDPKWDGKQLVIDTEFPRAGKKFAWHEVFSDITPNLFTQQRISVNPAGQ